MRISALTSTFAVLPVLCCATQPSAPRELDLTAAWFKPSLTINDDAICGAMLSDAQTHFESSDDGDDAEFKGLKRIPGPFEAATEPDSTVQLVDGDQRQIRIIAPDGSQLFAYHRNNGGCGGACETEQLLVSERPFPQHEPDYTPLSDSHFGTTPPAPTWIVYTSADGAHYVMGVVQAHLQAYKIRPPQSWRLSCDIALTPDRLRESTDRTVQTALKSVDALNVAIQGLSRGAGDCGSMHTAFRWRQNVEDALHQALYRPWSLRWPDNVRQGNVESDNSYGDYPRILKNFEMWSLGGLSEHRAFGIYRQQLAETSRVLGHFYSEKFGWPPDKSERVATEALTTSVSIGFGFYLYAPLASKAEAELRNAILDHEPMERIRAIQLDQAMMDHTLEIAIQYPEALTYLLEKGANPNTSDTQFSKTPLMYAAQFNALQAAGILLDRGADPNASTTWPNDTCFYTLIRARVTPLHYAVRYSSPAIVRLLLSKGAVTFAQAEVQLEGPAYPIDWLTKYAGQAVEERNLNIPDGEFVSLADLLRVPDEAELSRVANRLIDRAEAEYAAGKVNAAYHTLTIARMASATNLRSLQDLSLVAMKAGRLGESLEASSRLIAVAEATPSMRAAAWFNNGLACEAYGQFFLSYNGASYCHGARIRPFLEAWKLEHSVPRKSKLKQLFQRGALKTCHGGTDRPGERYYVEVPSDLYDDSHLPRQLIYIYHAPSTAIVAEDVQWAAKASRRNGNVTIRPQIVERVDVDDFSITVLGSESLAEGPVTIRSTSCSDYR